MRSTRAILGKVLSDTGMGFAASGAPEAGSSAQFVAHAGERVDGELQVLAAVGRRDLLTRALPCGTTG